MIGGQNVLSVLFFTLKLNSQLPPQVLMLLRTSNICRDINCPKNPERALIGNDATLFRNGDSGKSYAGTTNGLKVENHVNAGF